MVSVSRQRFAKRDLPLPESVTKMPCSGSNGAAFVELIWSSDATA